MIAFHMEPKSPKIMAVQRLASQDDGSRSSFAKGPRMSASDTSKQSSMRSTDSGDISLSEES